MYTKIFILRCLLFCFISIGGTAQNNKEQVLKIINANEQSLGGQKAYKKTRHISWTFFGSRTLWWDKFSGDIRIEIPKEEMILLWNSKSKQGKASIKNKEITTPQKLAELMDQAEKIWINDSYWLVMPFKLKDPGVNKKYLGTKKTKDGRKAELVELTFNKVGITPNNKYHIYFDIENKWVSQWDFFKNSTDKKPSFSMPWKNYQPYGKIRLSGDRGERKLTNIRVTQKLPKSIYNDLIPVSF